LDQTTNDYIENLRFNGSSANTNRALRTLRRMLYQAEECNLIGRAPKVKLMKEHGRSLRLDDDVERKIVSALAEAVQMDNDALFEIP